MSPSSICIALLITLKAAEADVCGGQEGASYEGKPLSVLLVDLKDPDTQARRRAVKALARMRLEQSREVAHALTEGLADGDVEVRANAAYALGGCRNLDEGAVAGLIRALKDRNAGVRESAVDALGRTHVEPDQVVPALVSLLGKRETRLHVARALGRYGERGKAAVPALIGMARASAQPASSVASSRHWSADGGSKNPISRVEAIMALGAIGPAAKEAVAMLRQASAERDYRVSLRARAALAQINPEAVAQMRGRADSLPAGYLAPDGALAASLSVTDQGGGAAYTWRIRSNGKWAKTWPGAKPGVWQGTVGELKPEEIGALAADLAFFDALQLENKQVGSPGKKTREITVHFGQQKAILALSMDYPLPQWPSEDLSPDVPRRYAGILAAVRRALGSE